jgi:hypothetical protein
MLDGSRPITRFERLARRAAHRRKDSNPRAEVAAASDEEQLRSLTELLLDASSSGAIAGRAPD